MIDIEEASAYFWNESILRHEAAVLLKAGFRRPVDFFDVPYVGLMQINGLNHEIALDVLFGMAEYCGIPENGDYDFAGEVDSYVLQMGFNPAEALMSEGERNYLNIDEMLYQAGYNGEETARMTIRQMLKLKHISMSTLQALSDTVWLSYVSRYHIPKEKYSDRAELLKNKQKIFSIRKQDESTSERI